MTLLKPRGAVPGFRAPVDARAVDAGVPAGRCLAAVSVFFLLGGAPCDALDPKVR
ncbi:hypothetical protein ACGFY7_12850 [Streptomyces prunicolor]|uniref:hypothetical protein n=1 Tax=Streptomyces prunicolor TaxID=67348 RepID=UPI003711203D